MTCEYKNGQNLPAGVRDKGDQQEWWVNGKRHRDGGLPAVEYANFREWWVNGLLHRDGDLPVIEYANGNKEWRVNGLLNREGGLPAVEKANGDKEWWVNGRRHRDGGLPAIEYADGYKSWWVNGDLHRDGGLPAIERVDGTKSWLVKGDRHREGGLPAVEVSNGDGDEWWINGKKLPEEKVILYTAFCKRMEDKKRVKAQKKIYFWWIQICYDMEHKSGCGQKMAQKNLEVFETMMSV